MADVTSTTAKNIRPGIRLETQSSAHRIHPDVLPLSPQLCATAQAMVEAVALPIDRMLQRDTVLQVGHQPGYTDPTRYLYDHVNMVRHRDDQERTPSRQVRQLKGSGEDSLPRLHMAKLVNISRRATQRQKDRILGRNPSRSIMRQRFPAGGMHTPIGTWGRRETIPRNPW